MNTLQQVSGAIGTTVAITIMSASQKIIWQMQKIRSIHLPLAVH